MTSYVNTVNTLQHCEKIIYRCGVTVCLHI